MFNRPEVSEVFITGMRRLGIDLFASISDAKSRDLCRRLDVPFIEENNFPVGRKMNKTLEAAMKLDWTHLMISGDDDIYTQSILDTYEQHKYELAVGFNNIYFVQPSSKRAVKFSYDSEKTIGAGRLISRSVVEMVLRICGELWEGKRNRSLDASMDQRLTVVNVIPKVVKLPFPCAIDIKTSQNIWSFDSITKFAKNRCTVEDASYEDILNLIPQEERDLINKIST